MTNRRILLAASTILLIVSSVFYYSLRISIVTSATDFSGTRVAEIVEISDGSLLGRTFRVRITIDRSHAYATTYDWISQYSRTDIQHMKLEWTNSGSLRVIVDGDQPIERILPLATVEA